MKNINLSQYNKYISTNNITFLGDLDRSTYIEKNERSMYVKIPDFCLNKLDNFILSLEFNNIYILNPSLSITCNSQHPIVCLSRPFLITNNSNSKLIHDYLHNQSLIFYKQFDAYIASEKICYLLFNYKKTVIKIKEL